MTNETLKYLIENNLNYDEINFEKFSDKMDTEEYNKRFITIENTLASLYEKSRILEKLREFTKKYIDSNILSKKKV